VQFVVVRDLADWILRAAEAGLGGVFNATGIPMTFCAFLDECKHVTGSDAELVWVPSERLLAAGLEEWMGVPLWIASPGWSAANRVDVSRAIAAGLTFRALEETIRVTLAWDAVREWRSPTSASRQSSNGSCSQREGREGSSSPPYRRDSQCVT
jgi:2'-hydroxyisoflavone reductase